MALRAIRWSKDASHQWPRAGRIVVRPERGAQLHHRCVPVMSCRNSNLVEAAEVAAAIPGARLAVLRECGHFAYIENPDGVLKALGELFAGG